MIHSDPDKRFTVGDVLSHSWMQGMTATSKEVLTEFNERLSEIQAAKMAELKEKKARKKERKGGKVYMSHGDEESKGELTQISSLPDATNSVFNQRLVF